MSSARNLARRPWLWLGWLATLMVLGLGLGGPGLANADGGVEKLRESGLAAYKSGDYAGAKKAFDEAYRLSPLHSLGIWTARARVKLNEWVQADERYAKLLKSPVAGDTSAEKEAQREAAREREQLRHRMPRLRIKLEGAAASEVEVLIDGQPVGEEFLQVKKSGPFPNGKSLEVNPGSHQILGVAGEQRQEVSVSVNEGETKDVPLRFVNPNTLRQRKCRDKCRTDCSDDNDCYMDCKHRCFNDSKP